MKQIIESITGKKVKTITPDFCFSVKGNLMWDVQQKIRIQTGFCIYSYSDKTIIMK